MKKGFISTSLVYTFFIVFLLILVSIITMFSRNRILLNSIKKDIKNELVSKNANLANYIKNDANVFFHSTSLSVGAKDNSYRYYGDNVNNFLCLNASCTDENMYQILGIINNKIEIVKYLEVEQISKNRLTIKTPAISDNYGITLENSNLIESYNKPEICSNINDCISNNNIVMVDNYISLLNISDIFYTSDFINWQNPDNKVFTGTWLNINNTWINAVNNSNNIYALDNKYNLSNPENANIKIMLFLSQLAKVKQGDGTKNNPYIIDGGN